MKNKANFKKISKRIATFVCVALSLATVLSVCTLSLVSCSSSSNSVDSSYVKVDKKGETITAKIPIYRDADVDSKDDVFVFGIDSWQSGADLSGAEPLAEAKIKGDDAKAEIEVSGSLSEMLCKGYLFAKKESSGAYTPITSMYYVTNPEDVVEDSGKDAYSPEGIKGAIGTVSELYDLGAGSTVITVNLSDLMSEAGGVGTIPYVWSGLTYYADREAVEALDKQVRDYTDAGVYVYLEIVQTDAASKLPDRIKCITFGAAEGKSGYALNMTDREGASRISGMLDLLADRYATGGSNGKATAFIMGRNVNNMSNWYAGGPEEEEERVLNYAKAVRTAYNILMSHTADGRVYISLDNNWKVQNTGSLTIQDMMTRFNNHVESAGDFLWQVSIEANASDRSDSSIWDDPDTDGKSNLISPSNIEIIANTLSGSTYTRVGSQRHILLNHFAVGGTDQEARAASYAYAYYKCLSNGTVDGLIYDDVDDEQTGLRPMANGDKTPITKVISTIDDDSCVDLTFAKLLIGSKWDKLYEKYSEGASIRSTQHKASGNDHSGDSLAVITDFSGGDMFGFKPSISSEYAELRYAEDKKTPALYVALAPESEQDRSGVISSSLSKETLEDAGYLGISTKVDSLAGGAVVTLRLSGYDKKNKEHVFVGETVVSTNEWTEVYFDIEDFVEKIDEDTITVSVMTKSVGSNEALEGLWMSEIVTEAPMKSGFPWWIFIILGVAALGVGIFFLIKWFRKNYTFVKE